MTTLNGGQSITVYANSQPSLEGATEIGSIENAPAGENDIAAAKPAVDAAYLIVFVTKLPEENDGRYRASITEVSAY